MPSRLQVTPFSYMFFLATLCATFALATWAIVFHGVYERQGMIVVALAAFLTYLIVLWTRPRSEMRADARVRVIFWTLAALYFPWLVTRQYFGDVTVNAFVFHLSEDITKGIPSETWVSLAAASVLIFVYLHSIFIFLTLTRHASVLLLAGALVLAVLNPVSAYTWDKVAFYVHGGLEPIRPFAADPVVIGTPAQPRNLVIVYLEGLESTYENEVFGDVYDPVASLRESATTFTAVRQMPMTGWSVAGLVASQCGYPTVPRGVRPSFRMDNADQAFMADRVCLGDLLSLEGYQIEMLLGAHAVFGGFEAFLRSHSYDRILDVRYLKNVGAKDKGAWGYHDSEVFKAGLERLRQLEDTDRPYALSLFTIGPHGPRGYLAEECRENGMSDSVSDVLPAVKCTGHLARNFINRAREVVDPATLFVVMSDHLAHPMVSATPLLRTFSRRNTVMFLGEDEPRSVVAKSGTLIDVYPTMLEALGYDLSGSRAGLGVSLFSGIKSFADGEQRNTTRQRFQQDVEFSRWLWSDENLGKSD